MMDKSGRGLVLFGFTSAGKTSLGYEIAVNYDMPFVDTDFLFEDLYGRTPREFVEACGREAFDQFEAQVISLLPVTPAVYSVGGGSCMNPQNVRNLKKRGIMTLLDTPKEVIKERIFSGDTPPPPFLASEEMFDLLYEERMALYRSIADVIIGQSDGKQ